MIYNRLHALCVITARLHATMPCLAFETPVLLIHPQNDTPRFPGLRELTRNCSREELLSGEVDFNFDDPPSNPKQYLSLRENLIKIVTNWVRCNA